MFTLGLLIALVLIKGGVYVTHASLYMRRGAEIVALNERSAGEVTGGPISEQLFFFHQLKWRIGVFTFGVWLLLILVWLLYGDLGVLAIWAMFFHQEILMIPILILFHVGGWNSSWVLLVFTLLVVMVLPLLW